MMTRRARIFGLSGLALLIWFGIRPSRVSAQQADIIRGHVSALDNTPIEGARITATSTSGNVSRYARTESDGTFTLTFANGDGDYVITITALGFTPKRMQVKRLLDEDFLLADVQLTRLASQLDTVQVKAARQRVLRGEADASVDPTEHEPVADALPAGDLSDVAMMAATLPGVTFLPGVDGGADGFSVFGLGGEQNSVTLNGLAVGATALPRDAALRATLLTSPYDVARGGFGGAQFALSTKAGSNYSVRGVSVTLDAPQLQWSDGRARELGYRYQGASIGGLVLGPIIRDKLFYNVAYQVGRRISDYHTLWSLSPAALTAAGISPDSVARFGQIAQALTPPTFALNGSRHRILDQGAMIGSFDLSPPTSRTSQALSVILNAAWARQDPVSDAVIATPTTAGRQVNWSAGVQLRHSGYVGVMLSETTIGVSVASSHSTPYLAAPAGRVRVNSLFPDGTVAIQTLGFNGYGNSRTGQTSTAVGLLNQLSWFDASNRHRLKLATQLQREVAVDDQTRDQLGTWYYNSLSDLEANQPASFARQLAPQTVTAGQLIGAMSLGDAFRPSQNVQLQYGMRVDGNHFTSVPVETAELRPQFGMSNTNVPSHVYWSPRIGFSWTYGHTRRLQASDAAPPLPRASLRGGVGVFQSLPATQLIRTALSHTGSLTAVQQLTCVGPATPLPEWDIYADAPNRIPSSCLDSGGANPFAVTVPEVAVFAPGWRAPRSLRGSLQWAGRTLGDRVATTIEATISVNGHQPSLVDLNFNPTSRFTLANENGRPVFVDESSIIPETGTSSASGARNSLRWSRVIAQVSGARSESRQLSIYVAPANRAPRLAWSLAYVYSRVREQRTGFESSTDGNPFDREWAPADFDARHAFTYTLAHDFPGALRVALFGQVRSGMPFTPMVDRDINGDGWANDRAFFFDPSTDDSTRVSQNVLSGMRSLLQTGASAARTCVRTQLGRLAARNSCRGPWTTNAILSISTQPARTPLPWLPERASLSFQLTNPLGAADLLLHGANHLHGWGQSNAPDRVLLAARGFDPSSRRYDYEVNERFGATDPARTTSRTPVTVTAVVRIDIGPTRERQWLTQVLNRGRRTEGAPATEAALRLTLTGGIVNNPMVYLLREQRRLGLSVSQADSLAALNRTYSADLDSIWSPVAKTLAALPREYSTSTEYAHYLRARRASFDRLSRVVPLIDGLLQPAQKRQLPPQIANLLNQSYLSTLRSGTLTYGVSGIPIPTGGSTSAEPMTGPGVFSRTARP